MPISVSFNRRRNWRRGSVPICNRSFADSRLQMLLGPFRERQFSSRVNLELCAHFKVLHLPRTLPQAPKHCASRKQIARQARAGHVFFVSLENAVPVTQNNPATDSESSNILRLSNAYLIKLTRQTNSTFGPHHAWSFSSRSLAFANTKWGHRASQSEHRNSPKGPTAAPAGSGWTGR